VIVMLLETGDVAGAAERFERERETGFAYLGVGRFQILATLADVAVDLAHQEAAAELLELVLPYRERMTFVHAIAPHPTARVAARLAALLGRYDDAEQLFATALELCGRFGAVYWAGRTHVERAEMYVRRKAPGDRERAERDLIEALAFAARCQGVAIERRVERVRAELGRAGG
jgi:hypothetical protein